jgi:hypothetical protein
MLANVLQKFILIFYSFFSHRFNGKLALLEEETVTDKMALKMGLCKRRLTSFMSEPISAQWNVLEILLSPSCWNFPVSFKRDLVPG